MCTRAEILSQMFDLTFCVTVCGQLSRSTKRQTKQRKQQKFMNHRRHQSSFEGERERLTQREMESCSVKNSEVGKPLIILICGTLIYYHCAYRNSSLLSLISDVFIVLLCSLAILGMFFRQMNISVPVDPLEWQISQDTATAIIATLANTLGAAESVLRVAATGHDKRLFLKVVVTLYLLSALGRVASGATVAYAGLCLFCLYVVAQSSHSVSSCASQFLRRRDSTGAAQDTL